jgi:hypothetical protein
MGVWHFAGLGTSPGAVTSPLAYLKNKKNTSKGFKDEIIDTLVLFTSKEVNDGKASVKEYILNTYMKTDGKLQKGNFNSIKVVVEFIEKEIKDVMPQKAKVYLCLVDTEDYQDCFEKVAKVLLKFSPPDKVGKNIWANLTGGTNILNSAIMQAAFLSGLISKVYYIYVSQEQDKKYLQPFTTDPDRFKWCEIDLVKTTIDKAYYEILKMLDEKNDWIEDTELLSILKSKSAYFHNMDIERFRREFLNKMEISIDRSNHKNKINDYGKKLLKMLEEPLIKALTERGKENYEPPEKDLVKVIWEKS